PADMVGFILEHKLNGVNFQLQLHKFIWDPNKRGV
ncbi:MAG: 7-carboxy-7-deazaguanine synthase QueE, partial [Oscillospiraceae bacterium]|nr:7-carboxy-7-deazaguanine synthase QueE [Oscillospiraceae bacterium]